MNMPFPESFKDIKSLSNCNESGEKIHAKLFEVDSLLTAWGQGLFNHGSHSIL